MLRDNRRDVTVTKAIYGDPLAILFLGTRSFTKKATVGSSRDYDLLILRVFAKTFLPHDCFLKATKVGVP